MKPKCHNWAAEVIFSEWLNAARHSGSMLSLNITLDNRSYRYYRRWNILSLYLPIRDKWVEQVVWYMERLYLYSQAVPVFMLFVQFLLFDLKFVSFNKLQQSCRKLWLRITSSMEKNNKTAEVLNNVKLRHIIKCKWALMPCLKFCNFACKNS